MTIKNSLLSVLLVGAVLTNGYSKDTYPKNPDIDIQHYSFKITLHDNSDQIEGVADILIGFKKEGITKIRLDLVNRNSATQGKGMDVDFVRAAGKDLEFTHRDNELWITIGASNVTGTMTIQIGYHGIPVAGLAIKANKYGDRTFFSDNWPNLGRHWLPLVDHPYDKATVEFAVTAPSKYQVISNGLQVEESSLMDGNKLTHWKQSIPIAPWLFVLGVAEFAVQYVDEFEHKSIQTWVYKQDRDAGFYDFQVPSKAALTFFSAYVGPFVYEKLANVQSNNSTGGMEAASAIMYGERSVTGKRDKRWQNVIVHEIAHQWFGDAVTESDWDDVWLSEGFATYFTLLYTEHTFGKDEFVKGLKESREQVLSFQKANPAYTVVHQNLSDMSKVTSGQTYQKGAWILHMLRDLIGDSKFQEGILAYYRKYLNANASTDDFRHEMEQVSGLDLNAFFHQWLNQGGSPKIEITWSYRPKEKTVAITVKQTQKDYSFDIPVEIGIVSTGGAQEIRRIVLSGKTESLLIPMATKPEKIIIDPRTVLIGEFTVNEK